MLATITLTLATSCQPMRISSAIHNGQSISQGVVANAKLERQVAVSEPSVGLNLTDGDRLSTGPNNYIEITDGFGTRTIVYPNTTVRIGSLWLEIGKMFVVAKGQFEVKDERVAGGVDGTAFLVESTGASTRYTVLEGRVILRSPTDAWPAIAVNPTVQCTIRKGRPPKGERLSVGNQKGITQEVNRIETRLHGPEIKRHFFDLGTEHSSLDRHRSSHSNIMEEFDQLIGPSGPGRRNQG